MKGEVVRLLRTNSLKETFEEGLLKLKQRLIARGYPENIIGRSLPEGSYTYTKAKRSRTFSAFCHKVPPKRLKI